MDAFGDFDSFGLMGSLGEDSQELGVLRIPKGIDLWRPKEECVVTFAFIPYITSRHRTAAPGSPHYVSDYWVYRRLGPTRKMSGIDAAKTFGRPCAITDSLRSWVGTGDEKKPRSQHMTLCNIYIKDGAGDRFQNKVVLFEHAFANFFEPLMEEVKSKANSLNKTIAEKYAFLKDMAHPVRGCWITVTFKEDTFGGHKFYKAVSFDFDKHGGLKPEMLSQGHDLETLLVDMSYEEQSRAFFGVVLPATPAPAAVPAAPAAVASPVAPAAPAPAAPAAPAPAAPAPIAPPQPAAPTINKGDKMFLYEKEVEVRKVSDDVVNVEDADGEPYRVSVSELTKAPRPRPEKPKETKKATPPAEPVAVAAEAEAPWDEAWDK